MRLIKDTATFHLYSLCPWYPFGTWMIATLAFLSWKYWLHDSVCQIYFPNLHNLVRHVKHKPGINLCRAVGLLAQTKWFLHSPLITVFYFQMKVFLTWECASNLGGVTTGQADIWPDTLRANLSKELFVNENLDSRLARYGTDNSLLRFSVLAWNFKWIEFCFHI